MSIHASIQRGIERVFFKGKSSKVSEAVTYVLINTVLMLVIFYIILNTIIYDWTGTLYTAPQQGFNLSTWFFGLDNLIPFEPEWAIVYLYLFFPIAGITMGFFAFVEYKRGFALGWSLILINAIADLIYIIFPVSTYWYRAALVNNPIYNGNTWATTMFNYYQNDPSFDCFPSLHAAVSVICAYAFYKYFKLKPNKITGLIAIGMIILAILVILSTLFVKQHYIWDEISGIVLALVVGHFVFKKLWNPNIIIPPVIDVP